MTDQADTPAPAEKTAKATKAEVRNVIVEVVKAGIKLPHSKHRLGRGHRCNLTMNEAEAAVTLGHIKIIGTV